MDLDTENYAHWLLRDWYEVTISKASRNVSWHKMKIKSKSVLSMILISISSLIRSLNLSLNLSMILWLLIRPLELYLFR